MKLSAFTLIKNAIRLQYPIIESINSLLPNVDSYCINLGDSDDATDKLIFDNFGSNPKVKIFKSIWETKESGMLFFRSQTNKSLDECQESDWYFYLQGDEAINDDDASRLRNTLEDADKNGCDAVVFNFLHFEKDYAHTKKGYSEGMDAYDQAVRVIKHKGIRSVGDAMGFSGITKPYISDLTIMHYGYVKSAETMLAKKIELKEYYFSDPTFTDDQRVIENGKIRSVGDKYKFSRQVNDFTGKHPTSMLKRIEEFYKNNSELL